MKFDYSVKAERDSAVAGLWEPDETDLEPFRTVLVIPAEKMDMIMEKLGDRFQWVLASLCCNFKMFKSHKWLKWRFSKTTVICCLHLFMFFYLFIYFLSFFLCCIWVLYVWHIRLISSIHRFVYLKTYVISLHDHHGLYLFQWKTGIENEREITNSV